MQSRSTLLYLGLHEARADMIWQRWKTINEANYNGDFGKFTRDYLRNLVDYERCDTGEPDVDWSPNLRRIGANEALVEAIAERGPEYDGVRLTRSAAEWVDQAIESRWEYLLWLSKASSVRAKGGLPLPEGGLHS